MANDNRIKTLDFVIAGCAFGGSFAAFSIGSAALSSGSMQGAVLGLASVGFGGFFLKTGVEICATSINLKEQIKKISKWYNKTSDEKNTIKIVKKDNVKAVQNEKTEELKSEFVIPKKFGKYLSIERSENVNEKTGYLVLDNGEKLSGVIQSYSDNKNIYVSFSKLGKSYMQKAGGNEVTVSAMKEDTAKILSSWLKTKENEIAKNVVNLAMEDKKENTKNHKQEMAM